MLGHRNLDKDQLLSSIVALECQRDNKLGHKAYGIVSGYSAVREVETGFNTTQRNIEDRHKIARILAFVNPLEEYSSGHPSASIGFLASKFNGGVATMS